MNHQARLWSPVSLVRGAKVAAVFVASIGCLVLIGWILDISVLKSVLPNLVTMKANTALGFILAGTSLFASAEPTASKQRWIGQFCSLAVVALGLATLSQYLWGWDLGIDQLIFVDDPQPVATLTPGRMSPLTAVCFAFVGSALWVSGAKRRSRNSNPTPWVERLAILTSLVAAQAIVAYLFQVQPIVGFTTYTQMAVHTAICFVVLAVGILMADPHQGLMSIITAESAGGIIARHLLPAAIAIPLILGGFRITTARMGLFEPDFGTSVLAVLHIVAFTGIVAWNAKQLHHIDLQRQAAARALSQANDQLEARIQERTAQLQAANERLSLAIEGAGMASWDVDLQTGKAVWSAQHFNLMGYEADPNGEATIEMWRSRIYPEDLEQVNQIEAHAKQDHTLLCPEYRIIRADNGQLRWLKTFGRFFYNEAGQAVRCRGIVFDSTDSKRAQEERDRFFTLSHEMIAITGVDGYFRQLNPAWERVLGYTQAELMAQPFLSFVHPDDVEATRVAAEQFEAGNPTAIFENRYRCKDGSYKWLSWTAVISPEHNLSYASARDVTERKQAEIALRESEERFRCALLDAPLPMMLHTEEGKVLQMNHAWTEITGYHIEDIPTLEAWTERAYGDRKDEVRAAILSHYPLTQRTPMGEYAVTTRTGETRIWDFYASPLQPLPDGERLVLATAIDVTERKQAEQEILNLNQELQRQLAESQTLLEVIPIGIGIAEDPQCQRIRVNSAFAQMLAIASTVNASLSAPEDERPTAFNVYQNYRELAPEDLPLQRAATQGIEVRDFEVDVVWHDGTALTLLEYAAPLFDEDGRSRGSIGAFLNITERKQAEVALQRSLKDLADLKFALDQSSIVAITDTQGTITYVNDKFCELSQYSREELIGQNHRIINSGYHPKEFFVQMWATIARGQVWQGEIRNRAKDGTFYWVATTIVPFLDTTGKPYQYIAVRSDITTRKAAEAELQQLNITLEQRVEERTAQLQEANKDLEAFSYTVAHDLRAPLRGIQGFAQALVEDYGDQLDETAQEYIQYIMEGTDRMNELVSDLLAYSRLSREQIKLSPVQLTQVVAEAQAQLEADLRDCQAQITVAENLPSILGNRGILVQMVANLLSNAVKFVAPEMQPQVQIWAEIQENWVRLWVEDNGIGIKPAYQEQIFGIFKRLHGIEAYPGTGIGLAIVRKGAERLQGRAGVESALGQGSQFWVELHRVK